MKSNLFIVLCLFYCLACTETATRNTPSSGEQAMETQERKAAPNTSSQKKRIVFFGNSLSAAYGLDPADGFVGLIEKRIDSLNLNYEVVNAGVSGETTAGGLGRIDWILEQPVDIFVLELGGNDGLRGVNPKSTYQNLQAIIDKVKAAYPDATIVLAGMEAPPNMGTAFTSAFRENYRRLARENDIALIPFLLENVGGVKEMNLPDGIHPNETGSRIVAENVWAVMKDLL